jgi:hypothetical protein
MVHERATLLDKKRLGKNQKARLATLHYKLDYASQPPATPPTPVTGERADWQGNVYAAHSGKASTLREMRRGKRFGTGTIQAMRSRIQRTQRKTRTGGVK